MRKLLALSCLLLMTLTGRHAQASEIITFGDSLVDTGNFSLATGGAIPPAPLYFNGRFSNGPVWVEQLANQLGLASPVPSLIGGTNFAFNGARVSGMSPYMTPDVTTQAGLYLASVGGAASPNDLYVVSGGSNDLFFSLTGQVPPVTPTDVAQDLVGVINVLAGAGAQEFIVPNLAPLGQTPFFNATPLAGPLDAAAATFNAELAVELTQLEQDLEIVIHQLDVHGLFEEAIDDPAAFGLTNVTDSATIFDPVTGIGIAPDAANPNEFLFIDSVHPTATVHQILADRAFAQIVPEPSSWMIWGILGMATGVFLWRTRAQNAISTRCKDTITQQQYSNWRWKMNIARAGLVGLAIAGAVLAGGRPASYGQDQIFP